MRSNACGTALGAIVAERSCARLRARGRTEMKIATLVAAVLVLAGACSSSSSERPTTQDERRAEIEQEQEQIAAENRANATAEDDRPDTWAEADAQRAAGDTKPAGVIDDDDVADDPERAEADNTGRNARDDEPGNLTALDQSNSASDVDITQAIRKKVVADDALSFNAKNVKIITVSGKVTLRGPVESDRESKTIEQSARAVPGVVAVDNQIEVKR
jgi:osmotically-inducible protein OsmY